MHQTATDINNEVDYNTHYLHRLPGRNKEVRQYCHQQSEAEIVHHLLRLLEWNKQVRQHWLPSQNTHTGTLWQLQLQGAGVVVYPWLDCRPYVLTPGPAQLSLHLVSSVPITWSTAHAGHTNVFGAAQVTKAGHACLTVLNCPAIVYAPGARHELVWGPVPCDAPDCEAVFWHIESRIQSKAACKDDCTPERNQETPMSWQLDDSNGTICTSGRGQFCYLQCKFC